MFKVGSLLSRKFHTAKQRALACSGAVPAAGSCRATCDAIGHFTTMQGYTKGVLGLPYALIVCMRRSLARRQRRWRWCDGGMQTATATTSAGATIVRGSLARTETASTARRSSVAGAVVRRWDADSDGDDECWRDDRAGVAGTDGDSVDGKVSVTKTRERAQACARSSGERHRTRPSASGSETKFETDPARRCPGAAAARAR